MADTNATEMGEVDIERQNRTLYVLGEAAMKAMAGSSVFLSGVSGLGIEIAKNIVLTGVRSFVLNDTANAVPGDLSTNFFITDDDIGSNRAAVCAPRLQELNPSVVVSNSAEDLATADLEAVLGGFKCVMMVDQPLAVQLRVNAFCHAAGIPFVSTELRGIFGRAFCDFGGEFEITEEDDNPIREVIISDITQEENAKVSALEHHFHELRDGDVVGISEVVGMEELNGREFEVTVVSPSEFTIDCDTREMSPYVRNGVALQVKRPKVVAYKTLAEAIDQPEAMFADLAKWSAPSQAHVGFSALHKWAEDHDGVFPAAWDAAEGDAFIEVAKEVNAAFVAKDGATAGQEDVDEAFESYLRAMAYTAQGALSPLSEFFGGFVAQEGLKALTHKFTPLNQWLYLDALEALPAMDGADPAEFAPRGDRYDAQRICLGQALCTKLADLRLFMVGAGAIGCELLKNFALLGVATTAGKGQIIVTDNDVIETSNLSRQFLFRSTDVQSSKAETAARAAVAMNPDLNVEARLERVGEETENIFSDEFIQSLDLCCNALDNVAARLYMDQRCVANTKPLLESGTLGTKGHVQTIVPHLTESYGSTHDPPEKDVAVCTIKSFPYRIEHCIQFARDKFAELFYNLPGEVNKFFAGDTGSASVEEVAAQLDGHNLDAVRHVVKILLKKPASFADCVAFARIQFEVYFRNSMLQLLHKFPMDLALKDGSLFWTLPKRPPTPIEFDAADPEHRAFISHTARLWANIWGIEGAAAAAFDDAVVDAALADVDVPVFVPADDVNIETDESVTKKEGAEAETVEDVGDVDEDALNAFVAELRERIVGGYKDALAPEEFEKDDDTNSHIDFITAVSNLRARSYGIKEADRLQTRRIAGKIIPAISTTTAAVSGLVALELIKIVQGAELESYRNTFMNLALPIVCLSEPGVAPKTKLSDTVEYTLWDKWEVRESEAETLKEFNKTFKKKYGLKVTGVYRGGTTVYMKAMAPHKKRLKKTMRELLKVGADGEDAPPYVDLTVPLLNEADEDVEGPTVSYILDGPSQ